MDAMPGDVRDQLAQLLEQFGIDGPDHPALKDRTSLGEYLSHAACAGGRSNPALLARWREERHLLSQAGVLLLRQILSEALRKEKKSGGPASGGSGGPSRPKTRSGKGSGARMNVGLPQGGKAGAASATGTGGAEAGGGAGAASLPSSAFTPPWVRAGRLAAGLPAIPPAPVPHSAHGFGMHKAGGESTSTGTGARQAGGDGPSSGVASAVVSPPPLDSPPSPPATDSPSSHRAEGHAALPPPPSSADASTEPGENHVAKPAAGAGDAVPPVAGDSGATPASAGGKVAAVHEKPVVGGAGLVPAEWQPALMEIQQLAGQQRYLEAFDRGVRHYQGHCQYFLVDACAEVARLAGRWDREHRIVPYFLQDHYAELAKALGKHVAEMRRFDKDPLRATSHLYHHANAIYLGWADHCMAVLEHRYRRTNTEWQQREWIHPQEFMCMLTILSSAVHEKMPLDLMHRLYVKIRESLKIGRFAISMPKKRDKFEGDCLRHLASPVKDVIPDLCYRIYRDVIDCYKEAGETATALTFCHHVLMINRGDREVIEIQDELRRKASPGCGYAKID